MCAFFTKFEELNAYLFAKNHFPLGMANRWELTAQFIRGISIEVSKDAPTVCIGKRTRQKEDSPKYLDLKTAKDCHVVNKMLPKALKKQLLSNFSGESYRNAMKSIILLSCEMTCCKRAIKTDGRP